MADPSKKRVVCPVAECEDKFVAETNKKSHYTNVHFCKDPSLPAYRPTLFREMSADDHALYTQRTGITLHSSPDYQAPPTASVFDLMVEYNISHADATILFLEAIFKNRGGDVRKSFASHAAHRNTATPIEPAATEEQHETNEEEEEKEDEVAPSPPKRRLTLKQQRAAEAKERKRKKLAK